MTVATLSGCVGIRKPTRKINTYNNDQDNLIPGVPNYYATSNEINGDVNGLVVTSMKVDQQKLMESKTPKQQRKVECFYSS